MLESLSPVSRLVLSYAPTAARPLWLGLLGLDTRLAQVVRDAREPMLAQIRLAWWRERLDEPSDKRPAGEPLLALLNDHAAAFAPLVDGWEALLGDPPLPRSAIAAFAEGRAMALGGLAELLGHPREPCETAGRSWALADLANRLSDAAERAHAEALATGLALPSLPRDMRPLVVLHGLAIRNRNGPSVLFAAMRLGIFGR